LDPENGTSNPESARRDDQPEPSLITLVHQLPEIYQPIYGHPDLASSRLADNSRVDLLMQVVTPLSARMERPLRVLDLGSAQGYLAFRLAELSHHVTGIDYLPINVAVARALADEHRDLDVTFIEGDVVDAASLVDLAEFDLVIGFAVLHHVAYRDGHSFAVDLVAQLAAQIPHAVFEMALASEPMYWAAALPSDPRITLEPYPFIRELGRTATHLGDVRRPVLYCSRSLALVTGTLEPIESWFDEPHTAAAGSLVGARRYFLLPLGLAILTGRFSESVSDTVLGQRRAEARRCAHVLMALAGTEIEAPQLLEFVDGPDEAIVVQTMLPGLRLDQTVGSLAHEERTEVTTQVLAALAQLEGNGLYHEDIRLWNVLWDGQGRRAHLIDYGAISDLPGDSAWPGDGYFSLLVFLTALWGTMSDQTGLRLPRASRIGVAELPPHVTALVAFLLLHPRNDHVIRDLAARWEELTSSDTRFWPETPLAWDWLAAVEGQRDSILQEREGLVAERTALVEQRDALAEERDAFASRQEELAAERDTLAEERNALIIERDSLIVAGDSLANEKAALENLASQLRESLDQARSELALVQGSKSWRLTAPLRRLRALAKGNR
jgi:O-antigen chain-terminating methyltransferase